MKKLFTLLAAAMLVSLFVGCGSTGESASAAETQQETQAAASEEAQSAESEETQNTAQAEANEITYPVEIENDWGSGVTVIEEEPNAIAVFDVGMLDILDTLGFGDRVVAVTHGVVIPEYLSVYESERYVNLGGFKDWDEEALAESNPDLILAGFRQTKGVETVDAIAPAIYFGEDDELSYLEVLEKRVNAITALFGGEAEAETYLEEIREKIAEIQAYTASNEITFICVTAENGGISSEGNNTSLLENDLGLVNLNETQEGGKGGDKGGLEGQGDFAENGGQDGSSEVGRDMGESAEGGRMEGEVSEGQLGEGEEDDNTAETVALILEKNPTYVFVYDKDAAELEEDQPSAQEVIEDAGLEDSDAYQNGNIVYVDGATWYSASGGLTATVELLDALLELFGLT